MPDRVIRDELLESERWISLKDNADRLAFVALLLSADSLGNFSAEPFRLMRLWRDFGINTVALVAKSLSELADHDLVRLYEVDGKPYLHIPRFRQRLRYVKRVFPPSPWTSVEQNQELANNSPDCHLTVTRLSPAEGKGSEDKAIAIATGSDTGKAPQRSKKIAATPLPANWEVTDSMISWAVSHGLSESQIMPETDKFADHHRSKGNRFTDWNASWRNWIRNAVKFANAR